MSAVSVRSMFFRTGVLERESPPETLVSLIALNRYSVRRSQSLFWRRAFITCAAIIVLTRPLD